VRRGGSDVVLLGCVAFFVLMVAGGAFLMTPSELRGITGSTRSQVGSPPAPPKPPKPLKQTSRTLPPANYDVPQYEAPKPLPAYKPETFEPPQPLPSPQKSPTLTEYLEDDEDVDNGDDRLPYSLRKAESLDYSDCEREPARPWTSASGTRTVDAGFWGADHVRRTVLLKVPGRPAKEYSWDKFSEKDIAWLIDRCEMAVEARLAGERQQVEISAQRLRKRALGTAKANIRSAQQSNAARAQAWRAEKKRREYLNRSR